MGTRMFRQRVRAVWLLGILTALVWVDVASSHEGCGTASCSKPSGGPGSASYGTGGTVVAATTVAQTKCPACNGALGAPGTAIAVEASSGQPRSFWQKVLRKTPPGITIYACGPDCASRIKSDPGSYLVKMIEERGGPRK